MTSNGEPMPGSTPVELANTTAITSLKPQVLPEKSIKSKVIDKLASRFFIHSSQPDYLSVTRIHEYNQQLPEIEQRYSQAERWHGTGRFQYRNGDVIDVLDGILSNGGLIPHQDGWDPVTGKVHRISTAPSRMYARLYAGMHFQEGCDLVNPCGDTKLWVDYFMSSLGLEAIREFGSFKQLLLTRGKKFWSEHKDSFSLEENANSWRGKVTKQKMPVIQLFTTGSDILGNYPVLIGIKENAFAPAPAAISIQKHEARAAEPIRLDDFTHIEVPLANVPETIAFLHAKGRDDIPVIPLEFGEEYCRKFPFSKLVNGGTMTPKDQVRVKSTTEISITKPETIPQKDTLAQYAPQLAWFYSPERALNSVHDIGHHTRVLILQEILAQSLIESGVVPPDIDRNALRWAAVTHDVRRRSDIRSYNHGVEAASWIDNVLPLDLPEATRSKIKFILTHHDENNQELLKQSPELTILEEADKLERCRLEHLLPPQTPTNLKRKVGLDRTYLHYPISSELIPLSESLLLLSKQNRKKYQQTPFRGVMDAAKILGVIQ